jgi:hypothetical protein
MTRHIRAALIYKTMLSVIISLSVSFIWADNQPVTNTPITNYSLFRPIQTDIKQTPTLSIKQQEAESRWGSLIDINYWLASGSFTMTGHPSNSANSWELKHPTDNALVLSELMIFEIRLSQMILINGSYGSGSIAKGTLVDTDWDNHGVIQDRAQATSKGQAKYSCGFLSYRFSGDDKSSAHCDISLGYHQLKNSVTYRNPEIVIENYLAADYGWQEKIAEYDLTFKGAAIRLSGQCAMSRFFDLQGLIGYSPTIDADYQGTRNPERAVDPTNPPAGRINEHINAEGTACETEFKLLYNPSSNLSVWLGYKYIDFKTKGKDASNTYWAGSHEELKTDLKGWLCGIGYKF